MKKSEKGGEVRVHDERLSESQRELGQCEKKDQQKEGLPQPGFSQLLG